MSSMAKQIRVNLDEVEMTFLQKTFFWTYFLTKAFLLAILSLMIILCLFLLFYFGDLYFNVKTGNYKSPLLSAYIIVSPSMVPTIKINDAVIVKRVNKNSIKEGDIITFLSTDNEYSGLTITHRVVDKQFLENGNYEFITKGDNNESRDNSTVKQEDIYGKVILKIPKIGYIQKFVSKPSGFLISILIPIGIVVLFDLIKATLVLRKKEKRYN